MGTRSALFYSYARLRGHHAKLFRDGYEREMQADCGDAIRYRHLRRLLDHARQHVPYYRELRIAAGVDPAEELAGYPILTKSIIRQAGDRLRSDDVASRHPYVNTSGGSTGEPIQITQDREFADRSSELTRLMYRRMGYEFGDLQFRLWGSEQEILHGLRPAARLWNRFYNTRILNAFRMTPDGMREYLRLIDEQRPRLLVCYAQAAYELARYAIQQNITIAGPYAMTCSAGTLYPFMREAIERVFKCPVYNWYGSREVGAIAMQLPGEPLLCVPAAGQYVEIVDDQGQPVPSGTEGDIVVTCLLNFSMPLIRYHIGDRGVLAPESADGVQRLTKISGRNVDTFRARGGTLVDGEYFTHLLYYRPWVRKFQFVQTDYDRIVLRIQPSEVVARPDAVAQFEAALPEIVSQSRAVLGPACTIDATLVDEIPPSRSGKFRYTICEMDGAQG